MALITIEQEKIDHLNAALEAKDRLIETLKKAVDTRNHDLGVNAGLLLHGQVLGYRTQLQLLTAVKEIATLRNDEGVAADMDQMIGLMRVAFIRSVKTIQFFNRMHPEAAKVLHDDLHLELPEILAGV